MGGVTLLERLRGNLKLTDEQAALVLGVVEAAQELKPQMVGVGSEVRDVAIVSWRKLARLEDAVDALTTETTNA